MTSMSENSSVCYRRFQATERLLHGVLMFSFIGLALTGMPLRFADAGWARVMARLLGGFYAAGMLHRVFATLLIATFATHVFRLLHRIYVRRELDVLWGPASMVPQPRDVMEMIGAFRWFLGLGPRPRFDHFTYWEKFDYWAVFWGMGIIGGSGLVLWFPEFFALVVPGWFFNVAMLVHGEEALLAVGFIFTVHFFNSHLRPEKFPMDLVIFTGRITREELREERPDEYRRMAEEGRLEGAETGPAPHWLTTLGRIVGTTAVVLGLVMVLLIVYALLA
ncbi:MAG: formate dehydrogenase subunit gamma [Vicinamibacterales bacterium]